MSNSSSLYPDILFHFTNKESLYNILNETFKVSYSLEKITGTKNSVEFGAPMVSFCDLKLSELKSHMNKYGKYGIGLTKEWAYKYGLNPVFYVNGNSPLVESFLEGVNNLYSEIKKTGNDAQYFPLLESYNSTLNMYRFMKNYEGDLKRRGKKVIKNFRFADEREWRYVPNSSDLLYPFAPKDNFSNTKKKNLLNAQVSHIKLAFQAEDIKYLIIERDEEISDLIMHLELAKAHYDENTRRRLASIILTSEQIHNDV